MITSYAEFLRSKRAISSDAGFEPSRPINPLAKPFQRKVIEWALRRGRAAIFAGTGLGKSLMEIEWASHVSDHTGGNVLILTPLAVGPQMVREGAKFGIECRTAKSQADVRPGITVTNYERLHHFASSQFKGIVIDESSCLKSFEGSVRKQITEFASTIPYRLSATATPAPNDLIELTNQSEFLDVMSGKEIIALFFTQDGNTTHHWRLKGHAHGPFWRWMSSWAVAIRKPSDIGDSDEGYDLPPLNIHPVVVRSNPLPGYLIPTEANGLAESRAARRDSMSERIEICVGIVNESHGFGIREPDGCGSLNTKQRDEPSIKAIKPIENDPGPARGLLRKTRSTCEPIIKQTKNVSPSIEEPGRRNETGSGGKSTQPTLHFGSDARLPLEVDANCLSGIHDSSPISGSTLQHTTLCSPHRMDGVLSADRSSETANGDHCTSTIVTQRESSGGCSAPRATSASGSSETILICSDERQITSLTNPKLDSWIIWVDLNSEQRALEKAFGARAISVYGSLSAEEKESRIEAWLRGDRPILISKPSVTGWGLNFQHCHRMAFVGLSYSFEAYYQAIRRCWRFGQTEPVEVHVITSEAEGSVVDAIRRKEVQADSMFSEIVRHMDGLSLGRSGRDEMDYSPSVDMRIPDWMEVTS